jgi:hypothetical protein
MKMEENFVDTRQQEIQKSGKGTMPLQWHHDLLHATTTF